MHAASASRKPRVVAQPRLGRKSQARHLPPACFPHEKLAERPLQMYAVMCSLGVDSSALRRRAPARRRLRLRATFATSITQFQRAACREVPAVSLKFRQEQEGAADAAGGASLRRIAVVHRGRAAGRHSSSGAHISSGAADHAPLLRAGVHVKQVGTSAGTAQVERAAIGLCCNGAAERRYKSVGGALSSSAGGAGAPLASCSSPQTAALHGITPSNSYSEGTLST